jgi:hypothetical protein
MPGIGERKDINKNVSLQFASQCMRLDSRQPAIPGTRSEGAQKLSSDVKQGRRAVKCITYNEIEYAFVVHFMGDREGLNTQSNNFTNIIIAHGHAQPRAG